MANVEKFKYWCNKILPLVYDDSLSYYEFLSKVYEKLNETIDAVNDNTAAIAEFDQRINDFIAAETAAREGWEDQQERDRQSWEDQQAQKWSAFQAMFISEYDPDDVYVKGDLCSVQYKMYVANASTTGTFDPSKWDEIVLSDYLAEFVQTAAADLQSKYANFLADYQRQFGIVQVFGDSITDAVSQAAITEQGMVNHGAYPSDFAGLADVVDFGYYYINVARMDTIPDRPAECNPREPSVFIVQQSTQGSGRTFTLLQNSCTVTGVSSDSTPGSAITWQLHSQPYKQYFCNDVNDWANLSLDSTYTTDAKHILSKQNLIPYGSKHLQIYCDDGYKFRIRYTTWDTTASFSPPSGYRTGRYELDIGPLTKYFRLILARSDGEDITPDEYTHIKCSITFTPRVSDRIPWCGKKISILGDSLSAFGGTIDDPNTQRFSDGTWTYLGNRCRYPQNTLLANVSDMYWFKIMQYFNMSYGCNDSWAATRVAWDGTESADVGADKYIASQTRINHLGSNGTPDLIIVNAGTNDIIYGSPLGTFNTENPANYTNAEIAALPVETFADAYRALMIRLQKTYPYAKIIALLPNYTSAAYTPAQADEYDEMIKTICDYFGVKWIDARTSGVTLFNKNRYLPDGTHYNANGMELLFQNIKNKIEYDP